MVRGISKYLVGIKTDCDKQSYAELSSISERQLKEMSEDKEWIYKIVEMADDKLKEYRKLNARCTIMDLFDSEFDSVIHSIREIEIESVHLKDYVKTLES